MMQNKIEFNPGSWLIPLWARNGDFISEESLLKDEQSEMIINKLNPDFSVFEKCSKIVRNLTIASITSRNIIINKLLNNILNKNTEENIKKNIIVINFGAGLDTKNFLFKGKVSKWYNIDLEQIISLREKIFDEKSKNINCNFLSFEWLEEVKKAKQKNNFIFLAEGLFMYFEKNVANDFLKNLRKEFPDSDIIFESVGLFGRNYHHPMLLALGLDEKYIWGDSSSNIENMLGLKAQNIISTLSISHPKWGVFRKLLNLPFGLSHLIFSTIYHFKL
jgi:O-methyltransferase involved in polyketide biosynthesis